MSRLKKYLKNTQLYRFYNSRRPRVGRNNVGNRIDWIKNKIESLPTGLKILDAGAGQQQFKTFCSHLIYVSQDVAEYDGVGDGTGAQKGSYDYTGIDIVSDITKIPIPNESFDVLMCTEVFEHLPEPIKAINEFRRILKIGGKLILTAPFCSLTHFAPYHYYSGFNRYFYEKHLLENGFHILEISNNGDYYEFVAAELRRLNSVSTKYNNKNNSTLVNLCIRLLLKHLNKLNLENNRSSELLNIGYHIFAEKAY